jgi:hypothetical protein
LYIRLGARRFARFFDGARTDEVDEADIAAAKTRGEIDDSGRRDGAEKLAAG